MTLLDWALIVGIALAVGIAVRSCIRGRDKTCTGDCASCGRGCGR